MFIARLIKRSSLDSTSLNNQPHKQVTHPEVIDEPTRIAIDEVADLTKAMRELLMTLDRYVYFGGLVAAAAITLGIIHQPQGRGWVALVFAPYAIGVSFLYMVQLFTEVERRAGYRKFLEERIRDSLQAPVLLYTEVNSWNARNRLSTWGNAVLNAGALTAFIWLGLEATRRYDSRGPAVLGVHFINYHYLNICGLLLLGATLIAAMLENLREGQRAYEAASAVCKSYSSSVRK